MDGDPGTIRSSAGRWSTFGTAATDASAQITGLDTTEFVGTEGDLFREGLNGDMPRHLSITGDAFGRVSRALGTFADTLGGLQDRMAPLAARAPGLWDALQAAQGRAQRAADSDAAHERAQAQRDPADTTPDPYRSDSGAAGAALSSAQADWDAAVSQANGLQGELITAVSSAVRAIGTAKDMRFKENPKWWDIGGQFTNFVRDNKDLLQKLSGALKIVSLVAGLLSFIPVLAPIMGPIALGSALLASAIDLSIYAATGEGSLKTILIDIGLNLLPGVGKLARMGAGALRGTRVATAFSGVANRGRNMLSVAKWGLSNPRLNGIEAAKRLVRLDPIDIATGAMVLSQTDVDLPGALPLVLSRTHISSYRLGSWFGRSWASTLDQRLEADDAGVYVSTADGMTLIYPPPAEGTGTVLPAEGPRWPLARDTDGGYQVSDPWQGYTWHYTAAAEDPTGQWPLAAITDRNGHRIDIHRTGDGTPVEIVHSGGYRIGVDTEANRVIALRQGDAVLLSFGYNEFGDLTEVTNSAGLPQRFGYDIEGRITGWTDRNGTEYRYTYDEAGRCVATDGTEGRLAGRIAYDAEARTTTVVDSYGHATVYRLNPLVQTESVTDPLGNTTRYTWDRYDRKLAETDPLGRTTSYAYTGAGDLARIIRPDGTTATATYNELHQPLRQSGFDGATWDRRYDERGNLLAVTDPVGATVSFVRDERGNPTRWTGPLGDVTTVECDAAGLTSTVTDQTGATVRYRRDEAGRVVALTDPAGGTTTFGYTPEGLLAVRTMPDGTTERWTYDAEGNMVGHTDALGQLTRFEVGAFDLQTARINPDGTRLAFGYDTELRLATVINPLGLRWTYEYDPAGRLAAETDFNGRTVRYGHDAAGQLVSRTNATGQVNEYVRDLVGNLVEKRTPEGVTRFGYDGAGRLLHAAGLDVDLVFERDPLGRVLAETCNGRTVSSTFDSAGRRTARVTPSGASARWEYGVHAEPTALHAGTETIRFGYDELGRETARTLDTGLAVNQLWDAGGRLLTQTVTARGTRLVNHRSYRYRPDGLLSTMDDRTLGLDANGRIVTVTGPDWAEAYAYDGAGNLTHASWPGAGEPGGRDFAGTLIRRAGDTRFEHDADGRVVLRQQKQRSTKPLTWRYTWDSEDRLSAVTTPDGTRWRYRYDPLGRRIAKQRLAADGGVAETVEFAWDGRQLAEQSTGGRATVWEWQPGDLRPVAQIDRVRDADQGYIDERFYAIVTDLVGAPSELVTPDGEVAWRARGNVWGAGPAGGTASCPLRFPGQYHDPETGLHYNYFRYYDPETASYQSADLLGLAASPNPHAYVSNPTGLVDPLGLAPYTANYTSQSAHHVFSHGHAANAPQIANKSRFRVTEGGQKFTDEVLGHPNLSPPVYQNNGRIMYEVPDLGRGPVGWNQAGNPVNGGRVIVEGPNPAPWSTFSPGEVVTQFPV